MVNNDEWILYTEEAIDPDNFKGQGRVRFCRPVYEVELKDGLKVKEGMVISRFAESPYAKCPPVTAFLDSLFRIKSFVDVFRKYREEISQEWFIRHFTQEYYDCMSGGMPTWTGVIIREFARVVDADKNMELYPGEKRWYTLKDFCEAFDGHDEELNNILSKLKKQLPSIDQFLLPENTGRKEE